MWDGAGARSVWARVRRVTRRCGARAERTANMAAMVVTLDVSKLSGWLNADAPCRVTRESIEEEGRHPGKQAGGWGGVAGRASSTEVPKLWRLRAGHARSARKT